MPVKLRSPCSGGHPSLMSQVHGMHLRGTQVCLSEEFEDTGQNVRRASLVERVSGRRAAAGLCRTLQDWTSMWSDLLIFRGFVLGQGPR